MTLSPEQRRDWHYYGPSSDEDRAHVDETSALYKLFVGELWLAWQAPHYDEYHPRLKYTFIFYHRIYRYKSAKNMYEGLKRAIDKRTSA